MVFQQTGNGSLLWLITPSDAAVYIHFGVLPPVEINAWQPLIIEQWAVEWTCLGSGMYALALADAQTAADAQATWPSLPGYLYLRLKLAQGEQRLIRGGDIL